MTLTKIQLVTMLIEKRGFKKRDAKLLVDRFYELISANLEEENTVKLSGFGNFTTRDKVSRPGRNPKTGTEVAISARRVVTFRAGNTLKKMIKPVE
ncbi:MAG: integration host factor subunit alpha [Legionellales bacterium]|nr:integration host factor subunit alpha [Legionellales bacterium]